MKILNLLVIFFLGAQAHTITPRREPQLAIEKRQMVKDGLKQWPKGIVPYRLGRKYNSDQRLAVAQAIQEFHNKTCIKWVARRRQKDYVYFILTPNGTCYSSIGKSGGRQYLGLSQICLTQSFQIVHEMMHAIGFAHEHQRTDRDEYVWVNYFNVNKNFTFTYDIANNTYTIGPYDYKSVMHYPDNYFAIMGRNGTIGPRDPNVTIQMGNTFSDLDVKKIRAAYRCDPLNGHIF